MALHRSQKLGRWERIRTQSSGGRRSMGVGCLRGSGVSLGVCISVAVAILVVVPLLGLAGAGPVAAVTAS